MSAVAARNTAPGLSPVVTLRLLAAASTDGEQPLFEPEYEQLILPLEWVRVVARPKPPKPPTAPKPVPELPDPKAWAVHITQAALEVLVGRRSAGQLARHIDPRAASALANYAAQYEVRRKRVRTLPPPRISSAHVDSPRPGAAEVTVVFFDGERFRAIAARLDAKQQRWTLTSFTIL